jgi:serine phosphatase RsbU (regulator of sigma subunit)
MARVRFALPGTVAGRALAVALSVKLIVFLARAIFEALPRAVEMADTAASLVLAAAGGYFLLRGLSRATRRLLWRVRRKLIISYVFIGFVPAILLAAFSALGALLLFSNFASYLVQARLARLGDRAASIAATTAREIERAGGGRISSVLSQVEADAARELPRASIAVLPAGRICGQAASTAGAGNDALWTKEARRPAGVAGPWSHVGPPDALPAWVGCGGFQGLLAYGSPATRLLARAVAFPEAPGRDYAVVVDLPVDDAVKRQLRAETGVELGGVVGLTTDGAELLEAAPAAPAATRAPGTLPLTSVSFLQYVDWETGRTGSAVASLQLSVREIYDKLSTAQGPIGSRSFGQGLLVLLMVVGVLFLIIEAFALVAGFALARSITGSVHGLFVGTERVRRGDFTHKIAVQAQDQLGELARSFNSMTASIEDLLREAAEKKRLEEELRIAREIQMSLLPQGPLQMPGLSVTAVCVPAREVGGDYYDFFPLGDDRLGVLIADVSGKGTSAALYMAELKGLMLSLSKIHTSPRELMISANRIIAANLDARSFITMTYAVIDLNAGRLTYARAGHTPLMYLPGAPSPTRKVQVLAPDGLVLGLKIDDGELFEQILQEEALPLRRGDVYLFYTDGISEAMNAADDCFGESRLARLLEEHAHLPGEELRERVLRDVHAFAGDTPQHDDMTMILLTIDAP